MECLVCCRAFSGTVPYALSVGVFRHINFMGLGVQIGIYEEQMSNLQLGIFCLSGAAETMVTAYMLTLTASQI